MGRDKFENEELIKYGWPEDVWFHADKLSSAHVYLRFPKDTPVDLDKIPESVLNECLQLTKANSIQGSKLKSIRVIYTKWSNLHKTPGMDVGAVGYVNPKDVLGRTIEKDREILLRIRKSKVEKEVDFRAERLARDKEERLIEVEAKREADMKAKKAIRESQKLKESRLYSDVFVEDNMTKNDKVKMTAEEYEDSFF